MSGHRIIDKLKDSGGKVRSGKKEVIKVATEFYKKLYDKKVHKV